MHIEYIEGWDGFKALRDDWDSVCDADPEAHFFLTWQWLADWFNTYRSIWFILAAKPDENSEHYVAFLPLRMKTVFDKTNGFSNEIFFAGAGFSDYAGILCRPEFEDEAVPAFSEYVKRNLIWSRFTMDNLMMSERRRRQFLNGFEKTRFNEKPIQYRFVNDPSNHGLCPRVNLPESWDAYLAMLSSNNRQKIRRLLKKVDAGKEYRITFAEPEDFDQGLTTLLDFWQIKWAPTKGAQVKDIAWSMHRMMLFSGQAGRLMLPIFWHGDRPVAALALLVDQPRKSLLFFVTGRDETYEEMPAGYLLHAHCIRYAIANGFTHYDFLKGNEPYKYLFAPETRYLKAVSVIPKTGRNRLDPKGLPAMLDATLDLENKGQIADAELGYRQILELAPEDGLALYRYGRLKANQRAHVDAKELLSRSVAADPDGDNAWLLLGRSLQALGEDAAALEAYRTVVKLNPQNEAAKKLVLELNLAAKPVVSAPKIEIGKAIPPRPRPIDLSAIDPTAETLRQMVE
ncbi:MAG TPA: GNAT family N-acetyltransferase, partial [Stellaceae bacterium]|nr:GNAT family N-acetyltransferase [Stellaceae bacterium]